MKCLLSCSGHPYVECGINGKVMQRLENEVRVARSGGFHRVTGEVIHEESSLPRGGSNKRGE